MESSPLSETWGVYPQLPGNIFQQGKDAGIDAIQMQILHNRGIQTVEKMQSFLKACYEETYDPLTLTDMPRAVERIRHALLNGEHITVYGDYDADGVTSSALLFRALSSLKKPDALLDHYIPHRLKEGCGLNLRALDILSERGTQLIITTDCASSDVEQVAYATTLGIDVIITDHHHPPQELPQAYAIVNPWRSDCTYGERYLCGVGISFKLTQALYRSFQRTTEEEKALLDLVAIGTIADIAPLLGENHTFVRLGMQRLNTTQKPGLQTLIRNARLQPGKIKERDIAFGLAPRINAAGRMKEATLAFQLMTTNDAHEAETIANELEQLNIARQQQTEELMRQIRIQALNQQEKSIVLVHGNDWHEGIIGLVAGKLAEEVQKPVLVLSDDPQTGLSRGSARSQKKFDIIEALRGYGKHLERYGGHSQAAGFTIQQSRIQDLHSHLLAWEERGGPPDDLQSNEEAPLSDTSGMVTEQESSETAAPFTPQMVDLILTKANLLGYQTYGSLHQLGPFGAGNPEPIIKMEHIQLRDTWVSGYNKQNLRLRFQNIRAIGTYTRGAAMQARLENINYVSIIFRIEAAEDSTRQEIWLKVLDVEPNTLEA